MLAVRLVDVAAPAAHLGSVRGAPEGGRERPRPVALDRLGEDSTRCGCRGVRIGAEDVDIDAGCLRIVSGIPRASGPLDGELLVRTVGIVGIVGIGIGRLHGSSARAEHADGGYGECHRRDHNHHRLGFEHPQISSFG